MGQRGPLPQSSNVVELRGNPGKRRRPPNMADDAPVGVPARPIWLKGQARSEWDRVTAELRRQGRIARTDRAILAAYCAAWARFVEVETQLDEYTSLGSKDQDVPSALFQVWAKLHERLIAAADKLAITVAARVRLPGAAEAKPPDPFEEMIGARTPKRSG